MFAAFVIFVGFGLFRTGLFGTGLFCLGGFCLAAFIFAEEEVVGAESERSHNYAHQNGNQPAGTMLSLLFRNGSRGGLGCGTGCGLVCVLRLGIFACAPAAREHRGLRGHYSSAGCRVDTFGAGHHCGIIGRSAFDLGHGHEDACEVVAGLAEADVIDSGKFFVGSGVGGDYLAEFLIGKLFEDAVAAEEEIIARLDIVDQHHVGGISLLAEAGLHRAQDNIAARMVCGLLGSDFAYLHKLVDKRVIF